MGGGAKVPSVVAVLLISAMAVLVVMVTATEHRPPQGTVTCKLVVNSLTACATYLIRGGRVPKTCCNGVRTLYNDADTTVDRQTACRCMEQAAKMVPGIKIEHASNLPGKCDVHIPYKISPTFNCSTVQ